MACRKKSSLFSWIDEPAGEEPLLVQGIDDEDSKRPVAPETFPPPASPRGATAPLGSPARFRAPDGDGNMMTMLEASFWDPLFVKAWFYQWILRRELLVQLDFDFSNLWGFTLLNFLMNVGQFTLPVLFVRHGWFAIILIALGSMLCAHTALLMTESLVQLLGFVESGEDKWCSTPTSWDGKIWKDGMIHPIRDPFTYPIIEKISRNFVLLGFPCQWCFCWEDFPHHQSPGLSISSMFNLHFWKVDATWSANTRLFRAGSSSSRSTICSSITSLGDDWIANLQLHELNRIGQGCCFCISCT